MGSYVYMGVRGAEQWFKAPAPRTPFQPVGWSATTQGRNGLLTGVNSRATHMRYELSWNTVPNDEAGKIKRMFHGLDGDGLIHWLDPMERNLAPIAWSYPALGCTDGAPIYGIARPERVTTSANTKGLPRHSAKFTAVGQSTYEAPKLYVPIPAGYKAVISVLGGVATSASHSGVIAQPVAGDAASGAPVSLPLIGAGVAGVGLTEVVQSGDVTGVEIFLALGETVSGTLMPSTLTLAGFMVQVVPVDTLPGALLQEYVAGGGNSGCRMFDPPLITTISAYRQRASVSAVLEEVAQ